MNDVYLKIVSSIANKFSDRTFYISLHNLRKDNLAADEAQYSQVPAKIQTEPLPNTIPHITARPSCSVIGC
jgi:hypothetical protein